MEAYASRKFNRFLAETRGLRIKRLYLGCTPINPKYMVMLKLLSFGKLEERQQQLRYDTLYHGYFVLELEDGRHFRLEKSCYIEARQVEASEIAEPGVKSLPLGWKRLDPYTLVANATGSDQPTFWKYHTDGRHCQRFVVDVIRGNRLLTLIPAKMRQDVQALVDTLVINPKLVNAVIGTAHSLGRVAGV